jgi:hypothetical protein
VIGFEIFLIGGIIAVLLLMTWIAKYGMIGGTIAVICRILWLTPLFFALFPKSYYKKIATSVEQRPIHILLDDSDSMQQRTFQNKPYVQHANNAIKLITDECLALGCSPKIYKLSELDKLTFKGFTPLSTALEPWLFGIGDLPWILFSDGGDYMPYAFRDMYAGNPPAASEVKHKNGLIVGYRPGNYKNVWVDAMSSPYVSFVGSPATIGVTLHRDSNHLRPETIQVQVSLNAQTLAITNANFQENEKDLEVSLKIPPLAKGKHLLQIKALPTGDEQLTWDNTAYQTIDVLSNTIGILHLLGSPSWDGRFMRRFLKAEPKYDLISFFILRDPSDTQVTSERDLSLIPFPRDRLFNEELPNFQCIVIQDFSLFKFLLPAYQQNLVNYVKNGGSILFIGGLRALQAGDFTNSEFASILPFIPPEASTIRLSQNILDDDDQRANPLRYNPNINYKVEFAEPTSQQRLLASVFDDWKNIESQLTGQKYLSGLHDLSHVIFKKEGVSPLLNARLADGRVLPLAAASYPGKGRAIWLFTDSFYKLALTPGALSSSSVYQKFFQSAISWLLRNEGERALAITNFSITQTFDKANQWLVRLSGHAARYFRSGGQWELTICGKKIDLGRVTIENIGTEDWILKGQLTDRLAPQTKCEVVLKADHPGFGSASATAMTITGQIFNDSEIIESPNNINMLARHKEARSVWNDEPQRDSEIRQWLLQIMQKGDNVTPARFETVSDHYWILEEWWIWLLLLCLPLEVLVRRWKQILFLK